MRKKTIIFLVGPTAVGKTSIAIELADKINAEIISCDSMQVYKHMDIGTCKPAPILRQRVKHHLLDIAAPDKEFSAADFRRRAIRAINAVHMRSKTPLFVGGTGLYVKALLDGLFPSPPKNEAFRKRLYREHQRHGGDYLHDKLKQADPESADAIHPNDIKKIVRALEIYHCTGKTKSELKAGTRPLSDKYSVFVFGLNMAREALYRRINERVDAMFEEGFLDEVKALAKRRFSITAGQAIGYKEAFAYLKGAGVKGVEELKELIKKNTRHYAKRQLSWFKADKRVKWIAVAEKDSPEKAAKKIWKRLY